MGSRLNKKTTANGNQVCLWLKAAVRPRTLARPLYLHKPTYEFASCLRHVKFHTGTRPLGAARVQFRASTGRDRWVRGEAGPKAARTAGNSAGDMSAEADSDFGPPRPVSRASGLALAVGMPARCLGGKRNVVHDGRSILEGCRHGNQL